MYINISFAEANIENWLSGFDQYELGHVFNDTLAYAPSFIYGIFDVLLNYNIFDM